MARAGPRAERSAAASWPATGPPAADASTDSHTARANGEIAGRDTARANDEIAGRDTTYPHHEKA